MNATIGAGESVAAAPAVACARPRRPARAWLAVAAFEFRMAARSRWTAASAALLAAGSVAISYFGLFGAGYLEFQGFERTVISLLSLALYVVPLIGLVLGLSSFGGADTMDLLFAQPSGRTAVVAGKLVGLSASIGSAVAVGLGAAGLFISSQAGAEGIGGYVALVGVSVALGAVFVGLAAAAALGFRDRLQASGIAIGVWAWFALLHELVVLGVLVLVPEASVRPLLLVALVASPVTLARALVLVALGAEPVLGPSGALLVRLFGGTGACGFLAAGLAAWLVGTWLCATVVAKRREV